MVRIEVEYEGELHTRCSHDPSGAELATDAPRDNQGRGAAFSPTDLTATSLASCMLTTMGIVANRHDWPMDGAHASIDKEMVADPERRIGRLRVQLRMPAGIPEEGQARLERAARGCPVARSLAETVEVDAHFDWA
jgi:putative redox protein